MTKGPSRPVRHGEFDFTLTVVCDHTRNLGGDDCPDSMVVAVLGHRPKPPGRRGFIEWLEFDIQGTTGCLQTYFGEALRIHGGKLPIHTRALNDYVPGMTSGVRWRFHCPACDDTVPARGDRVLPLLEALRANGVAKVTMAGLAARLT